MEDRDSAAPTPPRGSLTPGRILLIEDDDVTALLVTQAILSMGPGWQVERAATGAEGLAILETKTFSLTIVDYVLRDQSGLDVVRTIRVRGWAVAIVLVTAHGTEDVAVQALRLAVSDYLRKDDGYVASLPGVIQRVVAEHRARLQQLSAHSRLRVELAHRTQRGVLDNYTAPIVHDIKNPLTKISLMAELIQRGNAKIGSIQDSAGLILGAVKTISDLVERLLMFSRQQAEERTVVNLSELLRDCMEQEAEDLRLQNVRLLWDIPTDSTMVRAGIGSIQQALLNLVANASEALVQARGGGTITVSLREDGGYALISVVDDGPGLAPDILPNLFRPFATFGKGKRGTGLGLAIVASIVREHSGQIDATNLPGAGACFTVRLPLEHNGPVALILEDEPYVQELMKNQLEALGIRGEAFSDGEQILPILKSGKWDLVILDIRTPGMGGIAFFEEIMKGRPDLGGKTMVVSGCIEDKELQDLLAEHPIPCLPKPYTSQQFDDMVRLLLRGISPR
jgi:signal transduction histidine kinase